MKQHILYTVLVAILLLCTAPIFTKPIEYIFDNQTGEFVSLGLELKGKRAQDDFRIFNPGTSRLKLEGCLAKVTTLLTPEVHKSGVDVKNVKTEFKTNTRHNCSTLTTSIVKLKNGAYDVYFTYQ